MIPASMHAYLREHIPETAILNRTVKQNGRCYLEFAYTDELLLSRMGINCDRLGPRLVACVWDEGSVLEIGGYLVVDNLAMGSPSMGGIRMLPDVTCWPSKRLTPKRLDLLSRPLRLDPWPFLCAILP